MTEIPSFAEFCKQQRRRRRWISIAFRVLLFYGAIALSVMTLFLSSDERVQSFVLAVAFLGVLSTFSPFKD